MFPLDSNKSTLNSNICNLGNSLFHSEDWICHSVVTSQPKFGKMGEIMKTMLATNIVANL